MWKRWTQRTLSAAMARAGLLGPALKLADRWATRDRRSSGPAFPRVGRGARRRYQILAYHRVNDDADPFFDALPVRTFTGQMDALRRHCSVLPLEQLVERAAKDDLPPNAVAVTFDDGYRDNYECAFPVLARYGLPATIFLTTGTVGSSGLLWHDRLLDAFRRTEAASLELGGASHPMRSLREKRLAFLATLNLLRKSDPGARDETIARLRADLQVAEPREEDWRKLSWEEVREMAASGISFGAHTVTHPILTRVSRDEALREIVESKSAIESRLGAEVRTFAYPNGSPADYDESIKRILREAGFLCAATTVPGANDSGTDRFELRREAMWETVPGMAMVRLAWSRLSS